MLTRKLWGKNTIKIIINFIQISFAKREKEKVLVKQGKLEFENKIVHTASLDLIELILFFHFFWDDNINECSARNIIIGSDYFDFIGLFYKSYACRGNSRMALINYIT